MQSPGPGSLQDSRWPAATARARPRRRARPARPRSTTRTSKQDEPGAPRACVARRARRRAAARPRARTSAGCGAGRTAERQRVDERQQRRARPARPEWRRAPRPARRAGGPPRAAGGDAISATTVTTASDQSLMAVCVEARLQTGRGERFEHLLLDLLSGPRHPEQLTGAALDARARSAACTAPRTRRARPERQQPAPASARKQRDDLCGDRRARPRSSRRWPGSCSSTYDDPETASGCAPGPLGSGRRVHERQKAR